MRRKNTTVDLRCRDGRYDYTITRTDLSEVTYADAQ
jgi:hypothetical protein